MIFGISRTTTTKKNSSVYHVTTFFSFFFFSFLPPPCALSSPCCCPLQWQAISLTVIEKVQIAAAILGSLFLIASISWLIWSTFSPSAKWQRQDLLFQICYGMYGFMDIVCIGG